MPGVRSQDRQKLMLPLASSRILYWFQRVEGSAVSLHHYEPLGMSASHGCGGRIVEGIRSGGCNDGRRSGRICESNGTQPATSNASGDVRGVPMSSRRDFNGLRNVNVERVVQPCRAATRLRSQSFLPETLLHHILSSFRTTTDLLGC